MRDFYIMTLIEKIKKVNLTLLAITQLLGGLTFSLLSPFYTEEATQKGTIHTFEKKAGTVRKYIRVFYLVHNRESRVFLAIPCMDDHAWMWLIQPIWSSLVRLFDKSQFSASFVCF